MKYERNVFLHFRQKPCVLRKINFQTCGFWIPLILVKKLKLVNLLRILKSYYKAKFEIETSYYQLQFEDLFYRGNSRYFQKIGKNLF